MNSEQRIAFIQSQTVCAMADIEGMKADNLQREHRGESMAYVEDDFCAVPAKYGLEHNQVIIFLQG